MIAAAARCAPLQHGASSLGLPRRGLRKSRIALAAAMAAASFAAASQTAPEAPAVVLPPVEVIGTSPLPGQGIDRDLLPYSTQLIKRSRIDSADTQNLNDFMNRRVTGVQVNEIQGSPFQGDLTYRGFRASPLLGAGQGLSVYLDGVRINEPFGDVINFDLVPEFAIDSISLVPGANPAFGLNSLGGALVYSTHDGRTAPGFHAELGAGSFGRKRADLSYGFHDDSGWHAYIAATAFDEDGWRDHSDGDLQQLFGKIGRDDGSTAWSVGLLVAQSDLVGNGLLPAYGIEDGALEKDLYFHRREAVYTYPDRTENKLGQLSFNLLHSLDAQSSISALAYVRKTKRDTINGDEAEEIDDTDPAAPNAAFNTTQTEQTGYGAAIAYARTSGAHQWQAGFTVDQADVRYRQFERPGMFTADRGVTPIADEDSELSADVDGKTTSYGLYATDTWQVASRTHVTGTLRYNHSRVSNQLTTRDDDTGIVEDKPRETFNYSSLNPALGIAHKLEGGTTLFANIARNTRVPTVIELGCADPDEPCRLPAGLQADPYLEQVKSTTLEAGARWPIAPGQRLNVEAYRTDNRDDILFRSVSVNGQLGYFANFPKTRNQGVDLEYTASTSAFDFGAGYSFLDATYQADGVLRQGERNVSITPGTRIAGLPRHTLKLAFDWRVGSGVTLGADAQAYSSRTVSGNEDGLLEDPEAGEEPEAKKLKVPGYGLLNLRANWKPGKTWELYATVNNVFDRRYETFGALAETVFSPSGQFTGDERDALFVAPGAVRSFYLGLRMKF